MFFFLGFRSKNDIIIMDEITQVALYIYYSIIATRAIKRVYRNGVFAGKILERAFARGILLWKPLRYRVFRPCCDQCLFNRKWMNGHFLHSRRHKYNAIFARVHIWSQKKHACKYSVFLCLPRVRIWTFICTEVKYHI